MWVACPPSATKERLELLGISRIGQMRLMPLLTGVLAKIPGNQKCGFLRVSMGLTMIQKKFEIILRILKLLKMQH